MNDRAIRIAVVILAFFAVLVIRLGGGIEDAAWDGGGSRKRAAVKIEPVNINTAGRRALSGLPGIGKVLAEEIISLRKEKNKFHEVDELLQVRGIGRKKLENIKPFVLVE